MTSDVDVDTLKYANFISDGVNTGPSPTFKSRSKRTVVFEIRAPDADYPVIQEYFSYKHSKQQHHQVISQKELRLKMQQSSAPF